MSRTPKWWSYIRRVMYDYPRLRDELMNLQAALQSHDSTEVSGHSGTARPVERLAMATLPSAQEQREYEAVTKALNAADELTWNVIRRYFFSRYDMTATARLCCISKGRAYKLVSAFLHSVAENLALE